jgi:DNA mismatch endonuclease, patch repair protein
MADKISSERRSWNMSRISSKNTKPELRVRSLLHRMGYRFRLHSQDLPGKPDLVLPKFKKAIFVHGCFWHRHSNCIEASHPKTNSAFWEDKIAKNVARDQRQAEALATLGWEITVIWECELKGSSERVSVFLQDKIFHSTAQPVLTITVD